MAKIKVNWISGWYYDEMQMRYVLGRLKVGVYQRHYQGFRIRMDAEVWRGQDNLLLLPAHTREWLVENADSWADHPTDGYYNPRQKRGLRQFRHKALGLHTVEHRSVSVTEIKRWQRIFARRREKFFKRLEQISPGISKKYPEINIAVVSHGTSLTFGTVKNTLIPYHTLMIRYDVSEEWLWHGLLAMMLFDPEVDEHFNKHQKLKYFEFLDWLKKNTKITDFLGEGILWRNLVGTELAMDERFKNKEVLQSLDAEEIPLAQDEFNFLGSTTLQSGLSPAEWYLFRLFAQNQGKMLDKSLVYQYVQNNHPNKELTYWALYKLIQRLRGKMAEHHLPFTLKTVHGRGYVLEG